MFKIKDLKFKNVLNIEELRIPRHRINCIVGESGSGKTTLLKMLNKIISPDSGEILYNTQPLSGMDAVELRKEVIMLPQNPVMHKGTIRDNLNIDRKFSDKPPVGDAEIEKILRSVNLDKKPDETTDKMSGGEKQRLALGRVMLLDPECYLLDEPSSALDETTERKIIEMLVTLTKKRKKTMIMVTHSKKIAEEFADNIIEVRDGKIVRKGDV